MKFKISFWLLLFLSVGCLYGQKISALLISVIVHEAGHIAAIKLLGGRICEISANLHGVALKMNCSGIRGKHESILINLSGPLAGLLLAAFSYFKGYSDIFCISLWLSLFNLLPIDGLDGGEIFKEIKEKQ